jgi:hypothetical protein
MLFGDDCANAVKVYSVVRHVMDDVVGGILGWRSVPLMPLKNLGSPIVLLVSSQVLRVRNRGELWA